MSKLVFRIRRFGGWILGILGIIVGFLSGWSVFERWVESQNELSWIVNVYVILIMTCIFSVLIFRQYQTMRKERYANITTIIHQTMHCIRDIETFIAEKTPCEGAQKDEYELFFQSIRMMFGRALDQVNSIFTSITSTHCRASIKLIYDRADGDQGKLYYYTYTRDYGSNQKWSHLDIERTRNFHDPVEDNPQFSRVLNHKDNSWYFISNNLPSDLDFKSTSVTAYQPDLAHRLVSTSGWRGLWLNTWPLPYRSIMACVIRQGSFEYDRHRESDVLGLLTVDSESRGVFEERWDIQIMLAVADAMFRPLKNLVVTQRAAEAAGIKME